MRRDNRFYKFVFGKDIDSSLEKRIFLLITFLGVITAIAGNILNIALGFDAALIYSTLVSLLIMLFFFYFAKRTEKPEKHALGFSVTALVILILLFILNAGYDGNTINLFFVVFLGIYFIIPTKFKTVTFWIYLLILVLLIYLQHRIEGFVVPYINNTQRFYDLFIGNPLYLFLLYSLIFLVFDQYDGDRRNLEESKEQLRVSEEDLLSILNTSPDGISIIDLSGKIQFMSSSALAMHGYISLDEVKNKNIMELISIKDRQRAEKNFSEFLKGTYFSTYESFELLKKNEEPFFGQISISIQRDREGNPRGIIGITRDITEKIKLEEQLRSKQRMDSIGSLAGGIAHDFNNILTAISGYASILERAQNLEPRQKTYLTSMLHATKKAADLTKQLQSLTKTNLSEFALVDISLAVENVFKFLEKSTDKIIAKRNEIEKGRFFVNGNLAELEQVFLNLGTNSIHAIEDKPYKSDEYITARCEEITFYENNDSDIQPGEYLKIVFKDTGTGMTEEVKKKAFDPLFTTKDQSAGSAGRGLGLAVVYNIITRNHKGFIELDSSLAKGTEAVIYLPKSNLIQAYKDVTDKTAARGNETILIVDDEIVILEITREILEESGYKTFTAKNGMEALEVFNNNADIIDLVLLDLTMPVMGGIETMEKLFELNPDQKIVICTGHNFDETSDKNSVIVKAKGFISKPYNALSLLRKVRAALNNGSDSLVNILTEKKE